MTSRRLAAWLALLAVAASPAGCRHRAAGNTLTGASACAALDSVLAAAGVSRPFTMEGDAHFDVEQFRFRGRFRLQVNGQGDAVVELGGSTLFGGHREDVLVSLADDTLRVLDRERGRFYEGGALDDLVWDATRARGDWALVVSQVLGLPASCRSVESLRLHGDGLAGAGARGAMRLDIEDGRVTRAVWPDPVVGGTYRDRLDVRYRWQDGELAELTARLPERGWRVRLVRAK